MIIPSFYLAYNLLQENKYNQKITKFINNEITNKGYTIIYKRTILNTNPKKIELAFLTKKINEVEKRSLNQKLSEYEIYNTIIEIKQDNKDLKNEIINEIGIQTKTLHERDNLINNLQEELDNYKIHNTELLSELAILFPELQEVSLGKHQTNSNTDSLKVITVLLYQTADVKKLDTEKIKKWLSQKLKTNNIDLVRKQ